MTEMLEPAPMFGAGDDYGGPINASDLQHQPRDSDDTNNYVDDNAATDTEIDEKDMAHDAHDDASTPPPHPSDEKPSQHSVNLNIASAASQPMHEVEEEEPVSEHSGKHLISSAQHHHKKSSTLHLDEQRATSAGVQFGEKEERSRVDTESELISHKLQQNAGADSDPSSNRSKSARNKLRKGSYGCCGNCYARLYASARLRIFLSFLYLLTSLILVSADVFAALFILNEIKSFKYPTANTDYHELWFSALMVLLAAPYIICWAAHLIFIEENLSRHADEGKCCQCLLKIVKYPLMLLYLITPIGVCLLLLYEYGYIYVYNMTELFLYRFLCKQPSYKMIMNIKKTKGSRAYLRFRKLTHMLSSSIPLMLLYAALWYFDPYPRLKWKYLLPAGFISGLNSLFTLLSFRTEANSININLSQYFVLSFRLFGGFIPKLSQIKNGDIKRINFSSFAFGNYSYAKFADVIEYDSCKLETVILTTSTLSDLSYNLCHQLGAVCAAKNINIIILKNYSPYVIWFKYLFARSRPYRVTLVELLQALRNCDIFGDKADAEFEQLEAELNRLYEHAHGELFYYYLDFVNDWNGFDDENEYNALKVHADQKKKFTLGMFHRLLRILPPHIVDMNNKHTKEDAANRHRDERLLNLVLGFGNINEIDPSNKASALFYAIIQMDYDLINRLCKNGAKTSKDEWQKLGEYIIQLVKDNKMDALQALVDLIKQRKEIECDLTYADIDGKTAVMYAAMNGNEQICQLLLNCGLGADILHVDQEGNTAADIAEQYKHNHVAEYLRNQFL
eukprot:CAMPEP_0197031704 /NCGR_PEP_ID=MMETSP1384-20130603/10626_1 /TAXON_ID=29189 /ORGANISM="Ammonia sp." /LENGTH=791 /DNA_ID=CAMNT_0042461271 /DNA_START=22 /DNA_END=2397 /DNA_ORIENTATION=+